MKKIFTLLTALFAVMTVNAQTWDISKWETADVTATVTVDGLTYYGEGKSAYAAGDKTFADAVTWSGRIKLGGASTFKADAMSRVFSFEGKKGNTLKVYAVHGSSNGDPRTVYVSQNPTDEKNVTANSFGSVATIAAGESPAVLTATIPEDGIVYVWADNNVGIYAIVNEEAGAGNEPSEPTGAKETFQAVTKNGTEYVAADVFANAVIANGESTVKFGTANMDVVAVGGTTAKDVYQDAGTDFAGWTEWNAVEWKLKSQGDINFGYIEGTGVPAVSFSAEEVLDEGARTGHYRPTYEYFEADGSKGLPTSGVYYKFSPKVAGQLTVAIWVNKGNRITYLVDEATKTPVAYTAEGYINGQNEITGVNEDGSNIYGGKKWLSNDEIKAIHDASNNADKPYIIGAGNQPFWGNVTANVEAGKTYCLFVHNAQIGFQGYEFTVADGIEEIVAAPAAKNNFTYNLAGQRVAASAKGIVIINGKKYINK